MIKREIKKFIVFGYWKILFRLLTILPLKKDYIFMESFLGKDFSSIPSFIYKYLNEQDENYKYIISVRNPKNTQGDFTDKTKVVKKTSLKYLYYLSTSKYLVNNSRMPLGFNKRKNQIYLQTWHGTPLKKLVYDMKKVNLPGTNKEKYYKNFTKDVDMWDYLLASNKYSEEKFRSAFKYSGEIITAPYPQIEQILTMTEEDKKNIKKQLNIPMENKVLLYCPTFRDDNYLKKGHYIQDINLSLNKIKKQLKSDNITLILRNHYLIKQINYKYEKENILDLSTYNNINDLYLIADLLITDYSSVFFEYIYLNKPIIFYQYDQSKYKEELRDFYIPLEDLPGSIVLEEEKLYEKLAQEISKTNTKHEEFLLKYNLGIITNSSLNMIYKKIFKK